MLLQSACNDELGTSPLVRLLRSDSVSSWVEGRAARTAFLLSPAKLNTYNGSNLL